MPRHLIAIAALALVPASVASAQDQFNLFPTDGGGNWQVSCVALAVGAPACNSSFVNATRVTATPSGWASVPVAGPAGNAYYIAPTASATLWPSASNENANYQYTYRTTFTVGDYATGTGVNLNMFRLDNYFVGWSINGSTFSTAGLSPNGASTINQSYWATPFSLSIPGTGITSGVNTLAIRVLGNGRTDAILAQGTFSTVPEPGALLLLTSGLAGLGIVARRRMRG